MGVPHRAPQDNWRPTATLRFAGFVSFRVLMLLWDDHVCLKCDPDPSFLPLFAGLIPEGVRDEHS